MNEQLIAHPPNSTNSGEKNLCDFIAEDVASLVEICLQVSLLLVFSLISSVSALMAEIVFANTSMCFVFCR